MSRLTVLLDLTTLATKSTSRGIGRYSAELALGLHELARTTDSLRVLGLADLPLLGRPEMSEDIPALLEELRELGGRTPKTSWASRVRLSLGRAARAAGANVVHSLDPAATPWRAIGCPRIVTCHHVDSLLSHAEWHGTGADESRLERRRFSRADHVIAISSATAQDLIARLDIPRERISIVHNGADLSRWSMEPKADDDARRSALGLRRGQYLLAVGAADARKNVEGILGGLFRAQKLSGRADLELAWAGRLDRTEQNYLVSRARDAGVEDSVRRLGYVGDADLAALYRGAVALAFPSRREGFGYPVVEAMASGCPVITSNRSSMIEIAGDAAITVLPDDDDAIADAIVLLSDDNAERRSLSRRGLGRSSEFSSKRMAEKTHAVYEAVAKLEIR